MFNRCKWMFVLLLGLAANVAANAVTIHADRISTSLETARLYGDVLIQAPATGEITFHFDSVTSIGDRAVYTGDVKIFLGKATISTDKATVQKTGSSILIRMEEGSISPPPGQVLTSHSKMTPKDGAF